MAQSGHLVLGPIRFGVFELDTAAGELRKRGLRIKIEGQPLQILSILLEHPCVVVSREELRARLWPSDTFVDFEHSINTSIKRLRHVLDDSADVPRYIETVPRRGYRFIFPLNEPAQPENVPTTARRWHFATLIVFLLIAAAFTMAAIHLAHSVYGQAPAQEAPLISSIAVLPLQNLSGKGEEEFFADGFTEALVTDLSRIGNIKVTSRTSVMQYKGTTKPVRQIARELGVEAIIEGSVAREGDRVRITVQLVDAANDTHIWSERYDRDSSSVLALQGEVASEVARRVRVQLTPRQQAGLEQRQPVDPAAYELYLKARYFQRNWGSPTNLRKSVDYYERAIAREPRFAAAYAGLSMTYLLLAAALIEEVSPREVMDKARVAANKALECDPSSAEAYEALGWLAHNHEWDWDAAERDYRTSIQLNHSYSAPHTWLGHYLQTLGRNDEAIREMDVAYHLDPLSAHVHWSLAESLMIGGEMARAEQECQEALAIHPDFWPLIALMGNIYLWQDKYDLAILHLQKAVEVSGRHPYPVGMLASAYALSGKKVRALQLLQELRLRSKTGYVSPMVLVRVYASLGENKEALRWLRIAEDSRLSEVPRVRLWGPVIATLREDPDFQLFLQRMRLPAAPSNSPHPLTSSRNRQILAGSVPK